VPLRSGRVFGRGRFALAALLAALAFVLTAFVLPSEDLASSPARPAVVSAAKAAPPPDPYPAVAAHGAPIALLRRPVALRAAPGADSRRLARLPRLTEWGSPRALAVTGRRGGWLRVIATELPNGHRGWIPMAATRLIANPWSVTADLSQRRVTVRRHGRVVRRFPVAVGDRVTPTPTGRFAVTDKLKLGGGSAYGCCAVALSGHQSRIVNGWKGGDRLAIHGTHALDSIGTAASFGCLRARDEDIRWLTRELYLGTIVEIRP
jgi:lipoprotein-anchoring transpeptidase ErfK/SrfK